MIRIGLAFTALVCGAGGVGACGGIHSVSRDTIPVAVDPVLVQVIDGAPAAAVRFVSLSSYDVHPADTLPARLSDAQVAEMRQVAARQGATRLYIERVDDPLRRAFFGVGCVPAPAGQGDPRPCAGPTFEAALTHATEDASRCLEGLRAARPGLRGEVAVLFQLDADGRVMRAAPTPASTRDGMAQRCVLVAAHDTEWGAPERLSCTGEVRVRFGDAPVTSSLR